MTEITLKELYDFAKARPDEKFNVADITNCLACQLIRERGFKHPIYMPIFESMRWGFCANKDGVRHCFTIPQSFDNYCLFASRAGNCQNIKTGEEISADIVKLGG